LKWRREELASVMTVEPMETEVRATAKVRLMIISSSFWSCLESVG
jgi:hypothetical protein